MESIISYIFAKLLSSDCFCQYFCKDTEKNIKFDYLLQKILTGHFFGLLQSHDMQNAGSHIR